MPPLTLGGPSSQMLIFPEKFSLTTLPPPAKKKKCVSCVAHFQHCSAAWQPLLCICQYLFAGLFPLLVSSVMEGIVFFIILTIWHHRCLMSEE